MSPDVPKTFLMQTEAFKGKQIQGYNHSQMNRLRKEPVFKRIDHMIKMEKGKLRDINRVSQHIEKLSNFYGTEFPPGRNYFLDTDPDKYLKGKKHKRISLMQRSQMYSGQSPENSRRRRS